jgi:hypothetical protein
LLGDECFGHAADFRSGISTGIALCSGVMLV